MSLLAGIYAKTLLNTSEISRDDLNIANKSRSNPLRWNGQFSPQLVQVLLDKYAAPGSVLFDPFLGSGTVLLEAGLAGLPASGTEISPAAVTLAQTYRFVNVPLELRRIHLKEVSALLQREFLQTLPLFRPLGQDSGSRPNEQNPETIKSRFVELLPAVEERLQYQLLESLIVLLDFYQPNLTVDKIFTVWKKLTRLVLELPFSRQPIQVFHADARKTPLPDSSVDLVLTSPPYINVFNYHQQYRASMEALSWDLLRVARSEIGSNRKHRGNRFLTVIQFCLDIAQTFNEMVRVCRSDSRLIFLVGRESMVRGTPFFNGEIVAEIAHRALGFDLILKQERVFLNRFGQNIFEDILHFSPPTPANDPGALFLEPARKVAQDVLEATHSAVSDEAKEGIGLALANIDKVQPSPIFDLSKVCQTSKGTRNAEFAYSSPPRG
jgi:DNA modification methylase